ncbi:MAG TPA: acyl-CoA dehydrogenase family protein [Gemmatimonadales bacterium]|nr:acyl-CoA dehydrogenase family protein [Gemmatimonadales bacterium]
MKPLAPIHPEPLPPFQQLDLMNTESLLTDEERALRDRVRAWVDATLMPNISQWYFDGIFPHHLVGAMAELGLLGPTIPTEYGGPGRSGVMYGLIMQELERCDSGIRSFASVQSSLVMYPVWAFGSEAQKQEWLPKMARGEVIGCFGLTEPEFGSNPAGMIVNADEAADGWTLHGTKKWLSNGPSAHVAIVWAKTNGSDDPKSIRGFLVPTNTPGVTVHHVTDKHSLRVSESSAMSFDQVKLPKDALLPGSGGVKSPLMCLTQARYGIVWGALGAALACFDEALQYALQREMFGKPLAATQLQQGRLAEMATKVTNGQLLALQLGRLKDLGTMTPVQVSLAKRHNVDMACDVAREARRLLGANGILGGWHAMRHMANLESVYTYEGTHDMHTLIVGQELTGIPAYR